MRTEFRRACAEDVQRWLAFAGSLLLIGLALTALHLCGVRVCVFHRLTGLPCLTCGGTRAAVALMVGDVFGAFRVQPLVSVLLLAGAVGSVVNGVCLIVWRRIVVVHLSVAERFVLVIGFGALALSNWGYLFWCGSV